MIHPPGVRRGVGSRRENREPGENPGRNRRCQRGGAPLAKAGHRGNLRRQSAAGTGFVSQRAEPEDLLEGEVPEPPG